MASKRISQSEAARQVGCADRTVRRYVAAEKISTDDKGRVLVSELRRVMAKSLPELTDPQGRPLPADEVERVKRIRAVRILSYVLTVLHESGGNLDEAVSCWSVGWLPRRAYGWPPVPIGKPLRDALAWVPDAATMRVLSARWLALRAKSYPATNSPAHLSRRDKAKLPAGVVVGPANFGVLTKLKINGKLVLDRSVEDAMRVHAEFSETKLGRRAANVHERRDTTNRYKFTDLLGGVSRRMASYWWRRRGAVNFWPRFRRDVDEVFRSWAAPATRYCGLCGKLITGKPVDLAYCSEKCADDADWRDRTSAR